MYSEGVFLNINKQQTITLSLEEEKFAGQGNAQELPSPQMLVFPECH